MAEPKKVSMTCACGKCVNPDGTLKEKKCKICNGTGDYQGVDCPECEKKSVLTEADMNELVICADAKTCRSEICKKERELVYATENVVLANYKKGLRERLETIIKHDKTDYEYGEANMNGDIPNKGTKWKTPREIAEGLLKELGEK